MTKNEIAPGRVYLSIHDVPYRVLKMTEDRVSAKCETGRSKSFDMPVEEFAESMKEPAPCYL